MRAHVEKQDAHARCSYTAPLRHSEKAKEAPQEKNTKKSSLGAATTSAIAISKQSTRAFINQRDHSISLHKLPNPS